MSDVVREPVLSVKGHLYTLAESLFLVEMVERGLKRIKHERFKTSLADPARLLEWGLEPILVMEQKTTFSGVYQWKDVIVLYVSQLGGAFVHAAGDQAQSSELLDMLRTELPDLSTPDEIGMTFHFYDRTKDEARSTTRSIKVPTWEEIQHNYTATVQEALDDLMASNTPDESGQMLLWHGPPGTGKTFAIRALARAWSPWCSSQFVCDPEQFFGSASYLLSALLDHSNVDDKWRLIIIEDAGEMLTADARSNVGQGLSRLLNVVDGILGQGLRIQILMTTNESLERIHPAVARAGRCRSLIDFAPLKQTEARRWLEVRGHEAANGPVPTSIADLYALVDGRRRAEQRPALGFASL